MSVKNSKLDGSDGTDKDYFDYMRTVIKARTDPVWFCTDIIGEYELFPKQEELLRKFYQNRFDPSLPEMKYLIAVCGMRSGKTRLASMINAYEFFCAITLEDPSKHYRLGKNQPIFLTTVATSSQQAADGVFYNLTRYIESSEFIQQWFDLKIKEERIECRDKNIICQVLGSWNTTLAGRSNLFVCMDEGDLFEQATQGKRSGWEVWTTLRNSTMTFGDHGHCMAISSPKFSNGVIMSLYKDMQKQPNAVTILLPTWEMNPKPEATLEALKNEHKNNMHTFWRDFGCKPEIAGGMQFPEGVKLTVMENVLQTELRPKTPASRVMAIDPAVRNDSFGVACGYRNAIGDIIIDGVTSFSKPGDKPFISPSEIKTYIFNQIQRLNINTFLFDTWMFPNIIEDIGIRFGLREDNERCLKHIVSKEDYDRWRGLQDMPGDYKLQVVYDEKLEREANDLIIKSTDTGKPKTDHQTMSSKDMCDAVCNCIWYLSTQNTINSKPDLVYIRAF
jgi:hypothetical protein